MKNKSSINPMHHFYIHIPFCVRKCHYCNFVSQPVTDEVASAYFKALETEINQTLPLLDSWPIESIYFGGGTPSCIPAKFMIKIINKFKAKFNFAENCEITVECNPNSLTKEWYQSLTENGVNRFSLGVQSLDSQELKTMGRLHDPAGARQAFDILESNCSVDLIYGLPNQSRQNWVRTVTEIAQKWQPNHISFYALSIENGTTFGRWYNNQSKKLEWSDDDQMMEMYWQANEILARENYERYEISNFAKAGYQSIHNSAYWDVDKYFVGFGASAASFYPLKTLQRFHNLKNVKKYIERLTKSEKFRIFSPKLTPRDLVAEKVFLGLRMSEGVQLSPDYFQLYREVIENQIELGLIYLKSPETIALTNRGIEISNSVMADYI